MIDKIIDYHKLHTQDSLFKLMQAYRELWEEKITLGRFFKCHLNAV